MDDNYVQYMRKESDYSRYMGNRCGDLVKSANED